MRKVTILTAAVAVITAGLFQLGGSASAATERIEAESRDSDSRRCAPDGQRMRTLRARRASGSRVLRYPQAGCRATWNIDLDHPATGLTVGSFGTPAGTCVRWRVSADGAPLGTTARHCGPRALRLFELGELWLSSGAHSLEVTARASRSADALLDYLELEAGEAPDAPQNLTAAGGPGEGEITLTWQAPADDGGSPVSGYAVYRSEGSGGPYQQIARLEDELTYRDSGRTAETTYHYRVSALNEMGEGPQSNVASAKAPGGPPGPQPEPGPGPGTTTVPPTSVGAGLTEQGVTVPSQSVTTPDIGIPEVCQVELCDAATTAASQTVTTPAVEPGSVTTPEVSVPRTCVPGVACVGPFTVPSQTVGPLPSVPSITVSTPTITVPPLCQLASAACIGPATILPGITVTTPTVGPVATPPVSVLVSTSGFALSATPLAGDSIDLGPIEVVIPVPGVGDLPVTICPDVCHVPIPVDASLAGSLTVTVTAASVSQSVTIPVSLTV